MPLLVLFNFFKNVHAVLHTTAKERIAGAHTAYLCNNPLDVMLRHEPHQQREMMTSGNLEYFCQTNFFKYLI